MSDRNAGTLLENSAPGSMENACKNSSWKLAAGIAADDATEGEFDQISKYGSNRWRLYVFFEELPDDLFPDDCEPETLVYPYNFNPYIEPYRSEFDNDLYFSHPNPEDGDGESENDELDLIFDIIGGGSSSGLVQVGTSVVKYIMAGSGNSTDVSQDRNGSEYTFDIDLSGDYDDLPTKNSDEVNVTQVSLRAHNELDPDDSHYSSGRFYTNYVPRHTFTYADTTSCGCFDSTPIHLHKTISWDHPLNVGFESIK